MYNMEQIYLAFANMHCAEGTCHECEVWDTRQVKTWRYWERVFKRSSPRAKAVGTLTRWLAKHVGRIQDAERMTDECLTRAWLIRNEDRVTLNKGVLLLDDPMGPCAGFSDCLQFDQCVGCPLEVIA